jgi:hypothetical protein
MVTQIFTQKSMEALQSAKDIAREYGNQELQQSICCSHCFAAGRAYSRAYKKCNASPRDSKLSLSKTYRVL